MGIAVVRHERFVAVGKVVGIAVVGTAVETMEDGFVVESDVFSFENDVFLLSSILFFDGYTLR